MVACIYTSTCFTNIIYSNEQERSLATTIAYWFDSSLRQLDRQIDDLKLKRQPLPRLKVENRTPRLGFHSKMLFQHDKEVWLELDLEKESLFDKIVLIPAHVQAAGYGFPLRFKIDAYDQYHQLIGTLADLTHHDIEPPGSYPFVINTKLNQPIRYLKFHFVKHWKAIDFFALALAEIMVLNDNRNIAAGCKVKTQDGLDLKSEKWDVSYLTDFQSPLGPPVGNQQNSSNAYLGKFLDGENWILLDLGKVMPIDEIRLFPARPRGLVELAGHGFPKQFKVEASKNKDFKENKVLFFNQQKELQNPGDNIFSIDGRQVQARYLRLTSLKNDDHIFDFRISFCLAEIEVYSKEQNVARQANISSSPYHEKNVWRMSNINDGFNSYYKILDLPSWIEGLNSRNKLNQQILELEIEVNEKVEKILIFVMTILSILVSCLIISIIWISIRAKKIRLQKQLAVRKQISRDLHDNIGSHLGGIVLMSETFSKQKDISKDTKDGFLDIHEMALETSEAMRDMVWLIEEDHSTIKDFIEKLKINAQKLVPEGHLKFLQNDNDQMQQIVTTAWRHNVLFAFNEVLNNIRKHANEADVLIDIKTETSAFSFEITDTGQGFETSKSNHIRGLHNIKHRAETLGGSCQIDSKVGFGTKVQFSAPFS